MMKTVRNNYSWVPSLYLMQSLPFALVTGVAPILYKNFNYSNITITFITSLFTIPWFCKPLLAPWFETLASKRNLIISMQAAIAVLIVFLAGSLYLPNGFLLTVILFMLLALASSIHDMNSDGFYILNLDAKNQAHFIGVRTLFYQIGKILVQGGLIFLIGYFISRLGLQHVWQINLIVLACMIGLITVYHHKFLPQTEFVIAKRVKEKIPIKIIFKELVSLPYLVTTFLFVLFFNLPESALLKIVPLFLLDSVSNGGVGLSTEAVGGIFGVIGMVGMLLGIFAAGLLVQKNGLRRCLVPIAIFTACSNIVYLILSVHQSLNVNVLGLAVFISQCGFGLSNGIYMIFLLHVFGKSTYPMSQYAIGTSLMCLGMFLGGAISGYLQSQLGYTYFFLAILGAGFMIVLLAWYTSQKTLRQT